MKGQLELVMLLMFVTLTLVAGGVVLSTYTEETIADLEQHQVRLSDIRTKESGDFAENAVRRAAYLSLAHLGRYGGYGKARETLPTWGSMVSGSTCSDVSTFDSDGTTDGIARGEHFGCNATMSQLGNDIRMEVECPDGEASIETRTPGFERKYCNNACTVAGAITGGTVCGRVERDKTLWYSKRLRIPTFDTVMSEFRHQFHKNLIGGLSDFANTDVMASFGISFPEYKEDGYDIKFKLFETVFIKTTSDESNVVADRVEYIIVVRDDDLGADNYWLYMDVCSVDGDTGTGYFLFRHPEGGSLSTMWDSDWLVDCDAGSRVWRREVSDFVTRTGNHELSFVRTDGNHLRINKVWFADEQLKIDMNAPLAVDKHDGWGGYYPSDNVYEFNISDASHDAYSLSAEVCGHGGDNSYGDVLFFWLSDTTSNNPITFRWTPAVVEPCGKWEDWTNDVTDYIHTNGAGRYRAIFNYDRGGGGDTALWIKKAWIDGSNTKIQQDYESNDERFGVSSEERAVFSDTIEADLLQVYEVLKAFLTTDLDAAGCATHDCPYQAGGPLKEFIDGLVDAKAIYSQPPTAIVNAVNAKLDDLQMKMAIGWPVDVEIVNKGHADETCRSTGDVPQAPHILATANTRVEVNVSDMSKKVPIGDTMVNLGLSAHLDFVGDDSRTPNLATLEQPVGMTMFIDDTQRTAGWNRPANFQLTFEDENKAVSTYKLFAQVCADGGVTSVGDISFVGHTLDNGWTSDDVVKCLGGAQWKIIERDVTDIARGLFDGDWNVQFRYRSGGYALVIKKVWLASTLDSGMGVEGYIGDYFSMPDELDGNEIVYAYTTYAAKDAVSGNLVDGHSCSEYSIENERDSAQCPGSPTTSSSCSEANIASWGGSVPEFTQSGYSSSSFSTGYSRTAPTVYNDDDLYVGEWGGRLKDYQQNSDNQLTPSWTDNGWVTASSVNQESNGIYDGRISVGYASKPTLKNVDWDSADELFVGNYYGNVYFYDKSGSSWNAKGKLRYSEDSSALDGLAGEPIDVGSRAAPAFYDETPDWPFDSSTDLLVVGAYDKKLRYFTKSSMDTSTRSETFSCDGGSRCIKEISMEDAAYEENDGMDINVEYGCGATRYNQPNAIDGKTLSCTRTGYDTFDCNRRYISGSINPGYMLTNKELKLRLRTHKEGNDDWCGNLGNCVTAAIWVNDVRLDDYTVCSERHQTSDPYDIEHIPPRWNSDQTPRWDVTVSYKPVAYARSSDTSIYLCYQKMIIRYVKITGDSDSKLCTYYKHGSTYTPISSKLLSGYEDSEECDDRKTHIARYYLPADGPSEDTHQIVANVVPEGTSCTRAGGRDLDFYVMPDNTADGIFWKYGNRLTHDGGDDEFTEYTEATPAFVDMNLDNVPDLVVGDRQGWLKYYERGADWVDKGYLYEPSTSRVDVGMYSTSTFVDLGRHREEGDYTEKDMIVGGSVGRVDYYHNTAPYVIPNDGGIWNEQDWATCSGYDCGHKGCNLPLTAEKDKFVTEGGTCTFTRDGDLTFNGYLGLSGRSIPQHANTYQEKISEDLLGETDAFCMKSEFLGNAGKTQIDSLNVTYLYGQNVAQEGTALYCDEQSSETDYCYYYLEETADSLVGSGGTSSIQFTLPEDSDLVIYKAYVAFGAMNPGEYESSANTACSAAYDSGNGELDCSLSCMTNECTDANGFNSQSSCSGSVIGSTNQLDVKLNSVSLGNVQALDWGNLTCAGMCEAERTQYCQEESTLKPLVSCEKCRQGRTFWVADSNREQGAGYTSTNPLACYYVDHRGHGYENVFTTTVTTGLATAGAQCNDDVSNVCRERGFGTTYPPGNDKCIDVTYDGNNKYSDGCEYETNLLDADHFGHCINNFESSCYPYTTCSDTYNVFCWCTDTTCEDYPGGVGVGFDETTVVTEWYGEYDYDYNLIDVTEMADGLQAGVNTLAVSGTDARLENVGVFVIYKLPDD